MPDNNTFTAGVVPGGLTDHREIKILVCCILASTTLPLSHDDLLEALCEKGYANYFESADAVSELVESCHIEQLDTGDYHLLPSGFEIASILAEDVPLTVRERAISSAAEKARHRENMKSHLVSILPADGGYRVRCSVCDRTGSELFSTDVLVPTKGIAQSVRDRFIDRAEDIMRYTLEKLTEN